MTYQLRISNVFDPSVRIYALTSMSRSSGPGMLHVFLRGDLAHLNGRAKTPAARVWESQKEAGAYPCAGGRGSSLGAD